MAFSERIALIKRIQELRGSHMLCYLTSVREGVPGVIASDQVRVFFEHLLLLPSRPVEKLDVFLVSNGGDSVVPWRLVSLLREYAKSFNVLIPYRAYSAASLLALGADEIVMHPFAEIGPIDPTVTNDFNPRDEQTHRSLGISVEDVKAYINFIKTTVGITHEDELVKTIEILANKVHPLALGNVERFVLQSRMTARKILKTHMGEESEHIINEMVENMASKLYFHGHPINRREAKEDLHLKVTLDLDRSLESVMWDLYKDYEQEFKNDTPFFPLGDLLSLKGQPAHSGQQGPMKQEYELTHAMIESSQLSSKQTTKRRFTLYEAVGQAGIQRLMDEEILSQGWKYSPAALA